MDNIIDRFTPSTFKPTATEGFEIVIIYNNLVSAARALRVCDIIRSQWDGDAPDFRVQVWKASSLDSKKCRIHSASAAAVADVVIVSGLASENVSSHLRLWAEDWLARRTTQETALFLVDAHIESPSRNFNHNWLGKLARNAGVDCFAYPENTPAYEVLNTPLPEALTLPMARTSAEDWRPGAGVGGNSVESAFDIIENFGAHLRAHLESVRLNEIA